MSPGQHGPPSAVLQKEAGYPLTTRISTWSVPHVDVNSAIFLRGPKASWEMGAKVAAWEGVPPPSWTFSCGCFV